MVQARDERVFTGFGLTADRDADGNEDAQCERRPCVVGGATVVLRAWRSDRLANALDFSGNVSSGVSTSVFYAVRCKVAF